MSQANAETVLVVDDEEPVRRTFREWLEGAKLGIRVLAAPDAESALRLANEQQIDLAVLDWALGAGEDGLQLLQDLYAFHPNVVAIMVTGYANQATPLDAMRMGVRDYLDKNHDLSRETFVAAVRRQLDVIRPAKRSRQLHEGLVAFREAIDKVLPIVRSAGALTDPVPIPDAVRSLIRFLRQLTAAKQGALIVRHYDATKVPAESWIAYDAEGQTLATEAIPLSRSLAASVLSQQHASILTNIEASTAGLIDLQPFERGHRTILAAPMPVGNGVQAVLELFDKETGPFDAKDQKLVQTAAEFATDLLRQSLGQRQQQAMLLNAVEAALRASDQMAESLHGTAEARREQPPPVQVLDELRRGLESSTNPGVADASLQLAEAIRVVGLKHGSAALLHCVRLVESVRQLLDETLGS